jgi:short-subunit dehydrogenase
LVIGATSDVAVEFAHLHRERGDELHLVGRDASRLAELARSVEGSFSVLDFRRLDEIAPFVEVLFRTHGSFDRALIAHGVLPDQRATELDFESAEEALLINLRSVIAFLVPLANGMERGGRGRLCVIGSVAGERGRPRNYTYAAAKSAVHIYAEGLRSRLYASGVSVTTIKLGPVDTKMTRDHEKNFLFSRAPDVARSIVLAMDRRRGNVFVPGYFRWILAIVRALPEPVFQRVASLRDR